MKLQMLKRAMIAYVSNSVEAIWSVVAHPLTIVGSRNGNVKNYKIYGSGDGIGEADDNGNYIIPIEVRGKNLLDVNSVYPNYVNNEGGISYTNSDMGKIYQADMMNEYKEDTVYTLSFDYSVEGNSGNSASVMISYTDGTNTRNYLYVNTSGSKKMTSSSGKTIKSIKIGYSTANVRCNVKLTNMQLEEGAKVTDYEAFISPQRVEVISPIPLDEGSYIQKSVDGLPDLPQFKGTTVYEAQTEIPPSGIQVQYY